MKRIVSIIILLVVLFGALFGAGGKLISMQETLRGMKWAMQGVHGSAVYGKDGLLIFMFPSGNEYAASVMTKTGDPVKDLSLLGTGVKQGLFEAADRITYLTKNGWVRVYQNELPPQVVTLLSSFSTYLFTIGVGTLTTIPVIPLINYEPITAPEGIKQ